MQMLRGMGVKVIEIPTDPETGISVEALELALEQWRLKASFWCQTVIIRWDLLCRTRANGPFSLSLSVMIL